MPVSENGGGSRSYLNLAKLSHSDFLCLQDKEVPNIGAITAHTIMKMEPSPAYGHVCGRWKAELAPALLSC